MLLRTLDAWTSIASCRLVTCWVAALMMAAVVLCDGDNSFIIQDDKFVKDGQPIQLISGRCEGNSSTQQKLCEGVPFLHQPFVSIDLDLSVGCLLLHAHAGAGRRWFVFAEAGLYGVCSLHYFRIHPYHWEDRLQRMKAMGLNTVEVQLPATASADLAF